MLNYNNNYSNYNFTQNAKKILMRVLALLLCAACLITCCSTFFETLADGTNVSGDTITINYTPGSAKSNNSNSTVTVDTAYDSRLYSALLLDWDGFGCDNSTGITAYGSGNFKDWYYEDTISGYIPAFAGWKLTQIVADGITYDLPSSSYYYPDNDYIYTNDEPFASYSDITSLTFEAVWGKTVYLRDEYNFTNLGNVYGSDAGIAIAKINWDTSTTYASDTNSGATSTTPVASLAQAQTLLGSTGGKIVIVNHYTFEAPDGYYYTDWDASNGATYTGSSTNNAASNSTVYTNVGANITEGIITISGINQGAGYGKSSASDMGEGRSNDSVDNYQNAHFYMKETRGNGWYLSGSTKTTYKDLYHRLRIQCDTVIEGLNIMAYRESYSTLGSRATSDQYILVEDDCRLVIESSTTAVKRTTHATTYYGFDTTNWLYVESTYTPSGYSQMKFNAVSSTDTSTLYIGRVNTSNGTNRYLTVRGSSLSNTYFTTIYASTSTDQYNSFNNIHLNIENCYVGSLYAMYGTYGSSANFVGIYLYDVRGSTVSTAYGSVRADQTQITVGEYAAVVDGSDDYNTSSYTVSSFYVGLYNTTSSGYLGIVKYTNKASFYMEGGKVSNFYGGGNTVTCKSTGTFNFYINGGTIVNFYGGGNGGYIGSSTETGNTINITMTGGAVSNMYGGGAGGLVQLSSDNSPISLADYTIDYDKSTDNEWSNGTSSYYPSYASNGSTYYKLNPCSNLNRPYVICDTTVNGESYTTLQCLNVYYQGSDGAYDNFVNYYKSDVRYTISDAAVYADINITISGGTVSGSVYGGGKNGSVTGNITIKVTGGEIGGSVYGGGYGNDTEFTDTNSYVKYSYGGTIIQFYFTADTSTSKLITTDSTLASANSNIYYFNGIANTSGTSYYKFKEWLQSNVGASVSPSEYHMTANELISGYSTYDSGVYKVYIYSATINKMGTITGDTTVSISGGTIKGSVYGGSLGSVASIVGNAQVTISSGSISGSVFGGGNKGAVTGNTVVELKGGTVTGSIYGGGNEASVGTSGNSNTATVTISGGTINSSVYGGGNAGNVYGSIYLSVSDATISSSVFGGCNKADVTGNISVSIEDSTISAVFGGNNASGSISGTITVNVSQDSGTTSITSLYGGGNEAAYDGTATVEVTGGSVTYLYGGGYSASVTTTYVNISGSGTEIEQIFGGGSKGAAGNTNVTVESGKITYLYGGGREGDVSGNTTVTISGGNITRIYGGGYEGNVTGTANISVSDGSVGTLYGGGFKGTTGSTGISVSGGTVGEAYGGGNAGAVGTSNDTTAITVTVTGGTITTLYGGCNAAAVAGNITVSVTDATVTTLYGGNNVSGSISGSVGVTISQDSGTTEITTLYGGGNLADYSGTATVEVTGGTITNLYGGGLSASVGNTEVTVSGSSASVTNNIYGGGYEGDITGSTTISVASGSVGGNIYGGGLNGAVSGTTKVEVSDGTITGSIYGGGENGDVGATGSTASTTVNVKGGTISGSVYGGGYAGDIYGSATVSISDSIATTTISGSVYGAGYGAEACVTESTAVTINLTYSYTATESAVSANNLTSGKVETTITNTVGESIIVGSVYGGGNLGTVGAGTINTSTNSATITDAATTTVNVISGHIGGSVYGGGYGVPVGSTYNIYMGTVFGSTEVNIGGNSGDYVYIENHIFGGGSQSRVYAESNGMAATVNISSEKSGSIAIGGSVFGGGESGNSATTNASVPTTVGNVAVNVTGNGENVAATIYFMNGGVYGDGNLCLVNGTRTITITNLTTGSRTSGNLKTFYSLQRADTATLSNTQIVLLGATDLVAEGDSTNYSINRITTLNLTNGSTIKLDCIVNYLGALTSDVEAGRAFISEGNNGSNNYASTTVYQLGYQDATEVSTYITCAILGDQFNGHYTNTVCVANGLSLELRTTSGGYGTVTGLFTLSLLYAVEGEGGGFVYADIATSTGDFISITGYSYEVASVSETTFGQGIYYTRSGDADSGYIYTRAASYVSGTTYYTVTDYMPVTDDVGGYVTGSGYSYYYWFIQGSTISYSLEVTGYIGSSEADYQDDGTVPRHDATRYYVLESISFGNNDVLVNAVTGTGAVYSLVTTKDSLSSNQIAIEIMIGDTSLGFLYHHDTNGWGIYQSDNKIYYGISGSSVAADNILASFNVTKDNDTIYFVLHKSEDVSTETSGMYVEIDIAIYADSETSPGTIGNIVSGGTSKLEVAGTVNIVRLVPEQAIYKTTGRNYAGISEDSSITITTGSSFSVNYQTSYIPGAFPPSGGTMTWALSTRAYYYYYNLTYGTYMTLDENGACVNISSTLKYGSVGSGSIEVYYDSANNQYYYTDGTSDKVIFSCTTIAASVIPAGTKITMIDLTDSTHAGYYYYICDSNTTYIALDDFMVMGSTTTIENLTTLDTPPSYKAAYTKGNSSTQVSENIIFIFDFEDVDDNSFTDNTNYFRVQLQHLYQASGASYATDMMDFMQTTTDSTNGTTSYTRYIPSLTEYTIVKADGYTLAAEFAKTSYYDLDTSVLNVTITADTANVNTRLDENEYVLKIELVDSTYGTTTLSLPNGIYFEYNGKEYYPATSGTYVIIPVTKSDSGNITTAAISIVNELYSLSDIAGDTAKFKVTLYSAPDGNYYNYIEWGSASGEFGVSTNLTYALSVAANDGASQVLTAGGTLNFTVTTYCSGSSAEEVSVTLLKKVDGEYVSAAMTDLFTSDYTTVTASTTGTSCGWMISSTAEAGTYRIVFTYGGHVEYLNVVVY